jgi:hypothetical protein
MRWLARFVTRMLAWGWVSWLPRAYACGMVD